MMAHCLADPVGPPAPTARLNRHRRSTSRWQPHSKGLTLTLDSMVKSSTQLFFEVAQLLRQVSRPLFITGAGLSADSGLPTYRGVGGLYEGRETDEGLPIEEILSGSMLDARPALCWTYLWELGRACSAAQPNPGHRVIWEIERSRPQGCVLSQNIDGLHRAAGSQNLIEVHGRYSNLYCVDCKSRYQSEFLKDFASPPENLPPRCPRCDGMIRPDVVLFGEFLSQESIARLNKLAEDPPDIVFAVGTTALFPYIAAPVIQAAGAKVPTVEINPTETAVSDVCRYHFRSTAAFTLERLWKLAKER